MHIHSLKNHLEANDSQMSILIIAACVLAIVARLCSNNCFKASINPRYYHLVPCSGEETEVQRY